MPKIEAPPLPVLGGSQKQGCVLFSHHEFVLHSNVFCALYLPAWLYAPCHQRHQMTAAMYSLSMHQSSTKYTTELPTFPTNTCTNICNKTTSYWHYGACIPLRVTSEGLQSPVNCAGHTRVLRSALHWSTSSSLLRLEEPPLPPSLPRLDPTFASECEGIGPDTQ